MSERECIASMGDPSQGHGPAAVCATCWTEGNAERKALRAEVAALRARLGIAVQAAAARVEAATLEMSEIEAAVEIADLRARLAAAEADARAEHDGRNADAALYRAAQESYQERLAASEALATGLRAALEATVPRCDAGHHGQPACERKATRRGYGFSGMYSHLCVCEEHAVEPWGAGPPLPQCKALAATPAVVGELHRALLAEHEACVEVQPSTGLRFHSGAAGAARREWQQAWEAVEALLRKEAGR